MAEHSDFGNVPLSAAELKYDDGDDSWTFTADQQVDGQLRLMADTVDEKQVRITASHVTGVNATSFQTTPTYDGSGQTVHPDVVYDPRGWPATGNRYKYWMVYTPYPGGADTYENPSIVASNDGETWAVPSGLTNPIAAPDVGFYADGSLYLHSDDKLYCIYPGDSNQLQYKSSSDGVTWSAAVNVFEMLFCVSPCIVYDGSVWRVYAVDFGDNPNTIVYWESSTGPVSGYGAQQTCTGSITSRDIWHLDILRWKDQYLGIITSTQTGTSTNAWMHFGTSDDGVTWDICDYPIMLPRSDGNWDESAIYRASGLVLENQGKIACWYSAHDTSNIWHIGYTELNLHDNVAESTTIGRCAQVWNRDVTVGSGAELRFQTGVYPDYYGAAIQVVNTTGTATTPTNPYMSFLCMHGTTGFGATSLKERMRITSDGDIQIPTADAKITFTDDVADQKVLLYESSNVKYGMGIDSSEFRIFTPSGSAQHVSFGTVSVVDGTTWSETMRVLGDGEMIVQGPITADTNSFIGATGIASGGNFYTDLTAGYGTTGTFPVIFKSDNTERVRIDATGQVGIGTSTPGAPLHVVKDQNGLTQIAVTNSTVGTAAYSALAVQAGNCSGGMQAFSSGFTETGSSIPDSVRIRADSSASAGMNFEVAAAAGFKFYPSSQLRFIIEADGKVGLNKSSPDAMLEIVPNATTEENLHLRQIGSQTADMLRITDSSDNDLLSATVNGWWNQYNTTSIPAASLTDGYIQYGQDIVAGNSAPHFRTEGGEIVKLYQAMAHVADPTDLATCITAISTIIDGLKAVGLMAPDP